MGRYLIFMHIYTRERVSKRRVLHKEEKEEGAECPRFFLSISLPFLSWHKRRESGRSTTHTHTHKRIKQKPREKFSFAFKRTEGWLELFHKKWKGGFWESACGACACEWVCVRARAVFLWTLSRKERRKERVKLWSGEEEHRRKKDFDHWWGRPFRAFWSFFFSSFFSPSLFLFSPQCPTPNKNQNQKEKRKKLLRKFVIIISWRRGSGNSQSDDTTISKDVRITQWPRRTPH